VQVSKQEPEMVKFMEQSAEAFFKAMVASSHSFEKAVFYIGLYGRPGVNIVADGAIERTPARVFVLPMGLSGFVRKGDSASYRIQVKRLRESVSAGRTGHSWHAHSSVCVVCPLFMPLLREEHGRQQMRDGCSVISVCTSAS
jgi:hypothetical protein